MYAYNRCRKKTKAREINNLKRTHEQLHAQRAKRQKRIHALERKLKRSLNRAGKLLAECRESRAEIKALRDNQLHGIQRQRKWRGFRSHMTLAAKALTIDGLCTSNMSGKRWRDLLKAIGNHIVEEVEVDLKGASEYTCRQLMIEHDMVCLAHEKEELKQHT